MNIHTLNDGLQQWQDLFDEKVSKVYQEEPLGILKNLSMILFTIDREMKKVQDTLHGDVQHIRNMAINPHPSSPQSESDNKQSSQEEIALMNKMLNDLQNSKLMESPEAFPSKIQTKKVLSPNYACDNVILTPDHKSNKSLDSDAIINTSPELKYSKYQDYKRKLRRKRKLNANVKPTNTLLNGLSDSVVLDDTSFKENNVGNDACLDFFSNVKSCSSKVDLNSETPKKPEIKTAPRKSEDFDCSVIQGTPDLKPAISLKKDSKSWCPIPRRRTEKNKDLTLTQMLIPPKEKPECKKRLALNTTHCDKPQMQMNIASDKSLDLLHIGQLSTEQKDCNKVSTLRKLNENPKTPLVQKNQENDKSIGITMMVDLLDVESSYDSTKIKDDEDHLSKDEIQELADSMRFDDDIDDESTLNSGMLDITKVETPEEDYHNLNEFLAIAQNVSQELRAPPVVRGKARQKLPGWSCKECERFYKNQGLDPNEILVLNKCTKHRGFYKPSDETPAGFWDMDLRTQD